ncbi:MAG: allophanate hydrolase [Burkholderiales bacterium]
MLAHSLDLAFLADAYARGRTTPGTVVRDIYSEMPALAANPVWIHLLPQEAVAQRAREIETRRAAGARLPLYGVPFAVKDNIDVAGCPTTAACPAFSYKPRETAYAVQRLLDAGALLIGKTNLDQFATGLVGTRSPYGACGNAFNQDYISGGSSSGSAVAVAAGLVSFALGTDTAGSGRVPAGFNNIVGLKPTPGLVSTRGVVPACRSLDCVSVFALTCEDATHVLEVMRGFDAGDIYARVDAAPVVGLASVSATFRCGVPAVAQREFFGDDVARAAYKQSLSALRDTGAELAEIDFRPFVDAARLLYDGPWVAERYAAIKAFFAAHADEIHPVTRKVIESAKQWNAVDTFEAYYRLRELKRRCDAEWEKMDVLAVPTSGTIYTHAQIAEAPVERNTNLGYYTNFVNLLDLCALAVPGTFRTDGLPAGVTLIAQANADSFLAAIGSRFHRASHVPMGATTFALPVLPVAAQPALKEGDAVVLAVVGAHLSGLPLNDQLTTRGARLLQSTATAPDYRLYALPGTVPPKPGLVRVARDGVSIAVELWAMDHAAFGSFVAEVPSPLAIGTLTLVDGITVKGFLCESCAVAGAQDISGFRGWRAYLAAQSGAQQ